MFSTHGWGSTMSMTTRRLFFSVALAVIFFSLTLFLIHHLLTVHPTVATETRFLVAYTPNRALDQFRDARYSSSTGSSDGHGAGLGFATHSKGFDEQFVLRSSDRTALMTALDRDLMSCLTDTGAKVISETGSSADGRRLSYVAGPSTGTVNIEPPTEALVRGFHGWGPEEEYVSVRIRIEETWFKSATWIAPAKRMMFSHLLMQ